MATVRLRRLQRHWKSRLQWRLLLAVRALQQQQAQLRVHQCRPS